MVLRKLFIITCMAIFGLKGVQKPLWQLEREIKPFISSVEDIKGKYTNLVREIDECSLILYEDEPYAQAVLEDTETYVKSLNKVSDAEKLGQIKKYFETCRTELTKSKLIRHRLKYPHLTEKLGKLLIFAAFLFYGGLTGLAKNAIKSGIYKIIGAADKDWATLKSSSKVFGAITLCGVLIDAAEIAYIIGKDMMFLKNRRAQLQAFLARQIAYIEQQEQA